MFLSKRNNGIYYIFYDTSDCKRRKVSTRSKTKREALIFLSAYSGHNTQKEEKKIIKISFSSFKKEFLLSNPCNSVKRLKLPQKLPIFFPLFEFEQLIKVIKDEKFKATGIGMLLRG